MSNEPEINCRVCEGYYVSDDRVIRKDVVHIEPVIAREKVMCEPIISHVCQKLGLVIDYDEIIWDTVGRNIPDANVKVQNSGDFWIEHTRIGDDNHHFANENRLDRANHVLNKLGAPTNLVMRFPLGTRLNSALEFCESWETWDELSSLQEAYEKIINSDRTPPKQLLGFKLTEWRADSPRIYIQETPNCNPLQLIDEAIRIKEGKYGINASNTVLILDDETRAYSSSDMIAFADNYATTCTTTFRGIYLISFDGMNGMGKPTWQFAKIKDVQ